MPHSSPTLQPPRRARSSPKPSILTRWSEVPCRLILLSCTALLGWAGCTDAPAARLHEPAAIDAPVHGAVIATFEGRWDPQAAELVLADVATTQRGSLALYCPSRVTGGRPGTLGLSTDPGSIGTTPAACGLAEEFPYTTLGTFCADVTVTSFWSTPLEDVYVEITHVSPSPGHGPYRFPLGTTADPEAVAPGSGAPSSTIGLWAYGALDPGSSATMRWVFEYTPEPFTFRGRLIVALPERVDDRDDNCNGLVDEPPFAPGEACTADAECYRGRCSAGQCERCDGAACESPCERYVDADGDGFGSASEPPTMDCGEPPDGFSTIGGDCDDARPWVHPDAAEICDGRDTNCDGVPDDDATCCSVPAGWTEVLYDNLEDHDGYELACGNCSSFQHPNGFVGSGMRLSCHWGQARHELAPIDGDFAITWWLKHNSNDRSSSYAIVGTPAGCVLGPAFQFTSRRSFAVLRSGTARLRVGDDVYNEPIDEQAADVWHEARAFQRNGAFYGCIDGAVVHGVPVPEQPHLEAYVLGSKSADSEWNMATFDELRVFAPAP